MKISPFVICVCIAIILGIAGFLYAGYGPLDSTGPIPRFSYVLDGASVFMFGIAWFIRKRKTG
ncbi:hypothetical protein [Tengunoibacter tsumagoiensis]|uniref:Uncharacterized protein n=1 Tax=Tengunoibacter tsumagoiensis TaxID=2014871 RepID=A0A401ZY43_9CHLR|nr:hypothetical protein [Tengunoibacter tsumagoiensis]GCE11755.1 hypothetical protein KTT_16140 [Tengunoibacter tsumagoiensis]